LSAIGSTDMSVGGLMTSFQSLSSSGGGGISAQGQVLHLHNTPVGRHTTTSPYTRCSSVKIPNALSFSNRRASVSSSKRPNVLNFFFKHLPDLPGCLTTRGLLHECVFVTPSFLMSPRPTRSMLLVLLCSTSLGVGGLDRQPTTGSTRSR
jgi:hypothetical protein